MERRDVLLIAGVLCLPVGHFGFGVETLAGAIIILVGSMLVLTGLTMNLVKYLRD
jgi:hypothetical protein